MQRWKVEQSLLAVVQQLGAEVRMDAEVVRIGGDGQSVTLASGEVVGADIVVGASGSSSVCRKILEQPGEEGVDFDVMLLE